MFVVCVCVSCVLTTCSAYKGAAAGDRRGYTLVKIGVDPASRVGECGSSDTFHGFGVNF